MIPRSRSIEDFCVIMELINNPENNFGVVVFEVSIPPDSRVAFFEWTGASNG